MAFNLRKQSMPAPHDVGVQPIDQELTAFDIE